MLTSLLATEHSGAVLDKGWGTRAVRIIENVDTPHADQASVVLTFLDRDVLRKLQVLLAVLDEGWDRARGDYEMANVGLAGEG